MADDNDNTNDQTTQTTPPQSVSPPQQTSQESQSQPTQQYRTPPFMNDLRNTLDALPERIAMAVTASLPQTTPPPSQNNSAESSANTDKTSATNDDTPRSTKEDKDKEPSPPGKQAFSEWWFGVPGGTHRGNG